MIIRTVNNYTTVYTTLHCVGWKSTNHKYLSSSPTVNCIQIINKQREDDYDIIHCFASQLALAGTLTNKLSFSFCLTALQFLSLYRELQPATNSRTSLPRIKTRDPDHFVDSMNRDVAASGVKTKEPLIQIKLKLSNILCYFRILSSELASIV